MDNDQTEITICLGSSCFARGNRNIVRMIKDFLKENKLEEKVIFHGNHCFDKCQEGPSVKINDRLFTGIDENGIVRILEKHFYKF
jgi:NADH:ubiquinone oxidoreductase subunit E